MVLLYDYSRIMICFACRFGWVGSVACFVFLFVLWFVVYLAVACFEFLI